MANENDEMQELIKEFLVESQENLDHLDNDFVALEEDPANRDRLASIFRTIHTIKGTCGFLAFSKLEKIAHVGENLLSKLRDGKLQLTPDRTSALLNMVDAIRAILGQIEQCGAEGDNDYADLIARLSRLQQEDAAPAPAASAPPPAPVPAPMERSKPVSAPEPVSPAPAPAAAEPREQASAPPQPGSPSQPQPEPPRERSAKSSALAQEPEPSAASATPGPAPIPPPPVAEKPALAPPGPQEPGEPKAPIAAARAKAPASAEAGAAQGLSESSIRVDVGILDKLMNLVGELVLARNQILQFTGTQEDATLTAASQRLNLITTELQEGVMKTRMQPIGNVFSKFPRVVRDLSHACGKQVAIEIEGKETELDRTILEAIKDPLTHLVRNSVDHGIETPQVRLAKGKSAEGRVLMRAFHEGGQVNIEITDDGAGIDPEKIKRKAVEKGMLSPDLAQAMGDREALNLIFAAGFSTAEKITNVSGRGVGMDVVKTNIEKIGGSVDLSSQVGAGSTVRIKIPLTLAIVPALVVTSGGERFAIPQVSLLELVRLDCSSSSGKIEMIHGSPVYRLRGKLLPLAFLNKELRLEGAERVEAGGQPGGRRTMNIVVLQAGEQSFGLVVDMINDTQEIVVKPMGKLLKGLAVYAGATIMGDGKVALILDVLGLAQRAHIISKAQQQSLAKGKEAGHEQDEERETLLLFRTPDDGRMAIPLSKVSRLEEFPRKMVERTGRQMVVQYRGQILPLVRVSSLLPERRKLNRSAKEGAPAQPPECFQVVVYNDGQVLAGLVVDQILDIVEASLKVRGRASREGVHGTVVIQDRVTELLDLQYAVEKGLQKNNPSRRTSKVPEVAHV